MVVFHQMPYFLQHFAKSWVKTLLHGTLHKTLLISRRSTSFSVFLPNATLLQHFAKNWVKTLVHGTLQKKLLISRRSTSFGGFLPNAILFATFCQKLGQNPSARYFALKVAYFEEIDKFWWFLSKGPTFCNIFVKIGSKP